MNHFFIHELAIILFAVIKAKGDGINFIDFFQSGIVVTFCFHKVDTSNLSNQQIEVNQLK